MFCCFFVDWVCDYCMQELRHLRAQLHYAADYSETTFLNAKDKKMWVNIMIVRTILIIKKIVIFQTFSHWGDEGGWRFLLHPVHILQFAVWWKTQKSTYAGRWWVLLTTLGLSLLALTSAFLRPMHFPRPSIESIASNKYIFILFVNLIMHVNQLYIYIYWKFGRVESCNKYSSWNLFGALTETSRLWTICTQACSDSTTVEWEFDKTSSTLFIKA